MAILDLTAHPVAAKYAVLVDVGYLYAAAGEVLLGAKERKEYKVAADELIQALQKHAEARIHGELLRIYWYDAARDRVPTVDQRVIAQLPWVKVRLGNLNARGQQKGVDAQIRSDLEALARHHAVSDTILLAGDEDMVPAVEAAQAYGVRIHLWGVEPPYGTNQAERLVWEADTVEILSADFLRDFFSRAPPARPGPTGRPLPRAGLRRPHPGRDQTEDPGRSGRQTRPQPPRVEEVGEHVAQKWILTRGRDNIRDLLPGPILPTVIDTELLIEAEKELGHSLRPFPEARVWLRDGFWARVYREFDLGVGISSK
ncbi:NYN domain-containing protein [Planomonospora parontospora]|uniref:NYN domain-containing protein n=1 Tax=Planomonospora parontospora TaxID=58119 RepID=UPI00361D34CD